MSGQYSYAMARYFFQTCTVVTVYPKPRSTRSASCPKMYTQYLLQLYSSNQLWSGEPAVSENQVRKQAAELEQIATLLCEILILGSVHMGSIELVFSPLQPVQVNVLYVDEVDCIIIESNVERITSKEFTLNLIHMQVATT